MMRLCFKKLFDSRYYLGCIIYRNALSYVITKKQSKGMELIDFGKLILPLKSQDLIKQMYLIRKSHTVIGVANELSHLKLVPVARNLKSYYVEKYVKLNVSRFFKYTDSALYLDYRVILQNLHLLPIKKHQKQIQLLAVKKKDITQGLSALKQLKVKFSILSVEGVALIRLINYFFKPLPCFYLLLFLKTENFSILMVEKNYLIYKSDHSFISQEKIIQNNQIAQAMALVQSLYSSVNVKDCIILGNSKSLDYSIVSCKTLHQVTLASFIKLQAPEEKLFDYYAAIGLVL